MVAERGIVPPQERILERICKQIVDVHVSQVVEQVTGVPKTPSRDRILQCTVEQILDVLVPEMVKQLMEVPKTVPQDRTQQRTEEQAIDVPDPQVVEELVEVSQDFSQNRVQQRFGEQTTETPSISFVEKVVEMLVTQTEEKMQQVANTHVQYLVSTVKVERPKIIKQTVQKPVIQEKINQVIKRIEVPQFLNEVVDMLDAVQRQVSMVQKILKIIENLQLQIVEQIVEVLEVQMVGDTQTSESLGIAPVHQMTQAENVEVVEIGAPLPAKSVPPIFVTAPVLEDPPVVVEYRTAEIPVVAQRQIPMVQTVQKTLEIPQWHCIDKVVDDPVVQVVHVPQVQIVGKIHEIPEIQTYLGTQTSESLGTVLVHQVAQGEIVEAVENGVSFPAEITSPMFVEKPALKALPVVVEHVQRSSSTYRGLRGCSDQNDSGADSLPNCDSADRCIANRLCHSVADDLRGASYNVASAPTQAVDRPVPVLPAMTQQVITQEMLVSAAAPLMAWPGATDEVAQKTVEVARVIPQELVKDGGVWCTPRAVPADRQREEPEDAAPYRRRRHESDPDPRAPVHFSLCDSSSDLGKKLGDESVELETGQRKGMPVAKLDDILSEMRDVKNELMHVRSSGPQRKVHRNESGDGDQET